jgi:autotransporter-associated beta strand protein
LGGVFGANSGGNGGFGGGGGGAAVGSTPLVGGDGGNGGFGGGGGGSSNSGFAGVGGQFGGDGSSTTGGGGGGAGLGGAIFVENGGTLNIAGAFNVSGQTVTGGAGAGGAGNGSAYGSGLFLGGSGFVQITAGANQTVTIASNIADTNGTIGGVGSWGMNINGPGTTILSGNNLYSDNTVVAAGTLSVASDANLGVGTRVDLFGTRLQLTGTGVFTKDLGISGSSTVSVTAGQTATWAGVVGDSDTPAVLNVNGGGTLALTNGLNGYPDGTVITGGSEVIASSDGALGSGSAAVFLGDATSTGTLGINGSGFTSARAISLGALGGTVDTIGASDATLTGTVSGTGSFTKAGTGTLTLAGSNSYSGPTLVNAGTLAAGNAGAFGGSTSLFVNGGAAVNFNGFSQSFFTVSGGGTMAFGGGESLTIGADGSSSAFSGTITGDGTVVKNGAGTLTLSGSNSFTGGVFLNAGALSIGASSSLGSGALRMGDATTLFTSGGAYGNALAIAGLATVTTSGGQTLTWSGPISDNGSAGTLNLTGGGRFALTNGTNSYSGGTNVAGGSTIAVNSDGALGASGATLRLGDASGTATLAIDAPSFLSSRSIVLGSSGGIVDTAGGTAATLGGAISGAGGLTKTGAGTLTLAGSNSYGGGTSVLGGTLRAGGGSIFSNASSLALAGGTAFDLNGFSQSIGSLSGAGSIVLGGGASLTLGANNSSSAFGGSISGSGGLVKSGAGTLSLTGANSYTGGVSVLGGTLIGTSDSLRGNILNNATLVFDQAANGTYTGALSGSGGLIKTGAGALTLAGSSTYSGGTLISAGTLIGTTDTLRGSIVDNAALTFDQAANGVFSGFISGIGTVTKLGSGNVTFASTQGYTGLTTVGQGTLTLNAGLPGSVNVGTQATLAGTGTIGGSLTVGGRLFVPSPNAAAAPAGFRGFNTANVAALKPFATLDVPSLIVNGDLNATQGSTLDFAVSPAGASPILVNGRASVVGAHVNVTLDGPLPTRTATYTAIKTADGVSLSGSDATSPSITTVPLLTASQTALLVTVLNLTVPTTAVATTPNGIAAGRGIDAVKQCAPGDLCNVVHEVLALDDAHIDDALNNLAGEIHASSLRLFVADSRAMTDLVRNQLSDFEHESEEDPTYRQRGRQPRWWFQFTGEHVNFRRNRFSGATANVGGVGGGLDFKPASNWTVGGGASLSLGGMSLTDVSGSSDMKAPRAFGYSGLQFGPFHWHGGGSAAKTTNDTKRDIAIRAFIPNELGVLIPLSNGVDRQAESDQDGNTRDSWTELQHTKKFTAWTLDSKLGFRNAHFSRNTFNERGAGAISLDGSEDTLTSRESHVDIHLFKKTGAWRPRMLVTYRREFSDDATSADVNFQNRPDSQFEVTGLPVPRDTYHGLFGLSMRTLSGLEYTFEYETQQARDESHHAVHFRMRFR